MNVLFFITWILMISGLITLCVILNDKLDYELYFVSSFVGICGIALIMWFIIGCTDRPSGNDKILVYQEIPIKQITIDENNSSDKSFIIGYQASTPFNLYFINVKTDNYGYMLKTFPAAITDIVTVENIGGYSVFKEDYNANAYIKIPLKTKYNFDGHSLKKLMRTKKRIKELEEEGIDTYGGCKCRNANDGNINWYDYDIEQLNALPRIFLYVPSNYNIKPLI